MAVAPVVPAGFSAGMFAAGLVALCVIGLLIALRQAWLYTFGAAFELLARVRIPIPFRHAIHPLRFLHRYNVAVQNDIAAKIERSQKVAGYFFHGAAIIFAWIAGEVAALATDTLHWAHGFRHVTMPRLTKAMIIAAFPLPWLARRVAALVRAHAIPSTRTVIARTTRPVIQRVTRIVKAAAGAVAIPAVFWHLFPRVRDIRRDLDGARKRLRKLERSAGAVATVGLVAAALGRLGLNWIRCRRVSRVGKAVCGMDSQLLGSLLADATLIIGTISIVELTKGTQRIMPAVVDATGYLIREAPDEWNEQPRELIAEALALIPDFPV